MRNDNGSVVWGERVDDVAIALPQLEFLECGQTGVIDRDSG